MEGTERLEEADSCYKMNRPKKGLAIIFNHEKFDWDALETRPETEADCADLKSTLEQIGFQPVTIHQDLTSDELERVIAEVSKYDFEDYDCLLIAVLSYSGENTLYTRDGKYTFDRLFDPFKSDRCPTLAGKPKIFLIQACQGVRYGQPVKVSSNHCQFLPPVQAEADFLIAYSTILEPASWRKMQKRTWFIQAFCDEVRERWQDYDLMIILTFVNRRIVSELESYLAATESQCASMYVPMPCTTSWLTRRVKFWPMEQEE